MGPLTDAGMLFAEAWARPLLIAHAVLAAATAGAATHDFVFLLLAIRRGGRFVRTHRLFTHLTALLAFLAVLLGATLYPTYRVRARMEYLDAARPGVTSLFDLKENLGTVAVATLVAYVFLVRRQGLTEDRWLRATCLLFSFTIGAIVWFNVLSGLYIVSVRSV